MTTTPLSLREILYHTCTCENCGQPTTYRYVLLHQDESGYWCFCPDCGARMILERFAILHKPGSVLESRRFPLIASELVMGAYILAHCPNEPADRNHFSALLRLPDETYFRLWFPPLDHPGSICQEKTP